MPIARPYTQTDHAVSTIHRKWNNGGSEIPARGTNATQSPAATDGGGARSSQELSNQQAQTSLKELKSSYTALKQKLTYHHNRAREVQEGMDRLQSEINHWTNILLLSTTSHPKPVRQPPTSNFNKGVGAGTTNVNNAPFQTAVAAKTGLPRSAPSAFSPPKPLVTTMSNPIHRPSATPASPEQLRELQRLLQNAIQAHATLPPAGKPTSEDSALQQSSLSARTFEGNMIDAVPAPTNHHDHIMSMQALLLRKVDEKLAELSASNEPVLLGPPPESLLYLEELRSAVTAWAASMNPTT